MQKYNHMEIYKAYLLNLQTEDHLSACNKTRVDNNVPKRTMQRIVKKFKKDKSENLNSFTFKSSTDFEIKRPKILIFDIETTPNLAWVWGKYEQNVLDFVSEWSLLCFAAKWLDEDKVTIVGTDSMSEAELVQKMWEFLNEADIVIAHNGNSFDIKKANAKFIEFGLDKPSSFKSIDTKLVAKKYFKFNSNKLDDLGRFLGLGRKLHHTGFELWLGCMRGELESWQMMKNYNVQDVILLEKVYFKMRPYMNDHPSIGLMMNIPNACPNCGGSELQEKGFVYTRTGKSREYQCKECRSYSKGKHSKVTDIK